MKKNLKYLLLLVVIFMGVVCTGFIMKSLFNLHFTGRELAALTGLFCLNSAVTLLVFFRGLDKPAREQVLHSFMAVSLKFLIELFLALAWFMVAKKTSITYVLLFFVLYLSFSTFSIGVMLKTLKKKPL